jgi:ABC-type nitrate/sulfonate/bicarbonate transport system ATPase subunit
MLCFCGPGLSIQVLFHWVTVEDNIAFGLQMKDVARQKQKSIVQNYIHLVGLTGFEKRYPHQLSGGMRLRCC